MRILLMAVTIQTSPELTPNHPTGAESSRSPRKYAFIDALRGLAFVGVLLTHARPRVPGVNPWVVDILGHGGEGVQLFFLMSALTLFLSLDSRRRTESRPVVNFFIRRFFRIAPLFYAGALFYYWFDRAMTGGNGPGGSSLGCILSTLTFTNGWSVDWINKLVPGGWSIAVEMNFYLLVPWLYRRFRSAQGAATAAFVALIVGGSASVAVKMFLTRALGPGSADSITLFAWYWLPIQIPVFLAGIFLYFLLRPLLQGGPDAPAVVRPKAGLLLAMAAYLMIALSLSNTPLYLGHALFVVAFVLLAWSLAIRPNPWIVNRATCYLGTISFSGYLTHFAVLDLTELGLRHLPTTALRSAPPLLQLTALITTTLAGTVLVSTLTHRLIEVPGQALGRRLIRHLESSRTATEVCTATA
jgi:peptidoglycan/LPS O-acetylase OafA/YrhL